MRLITKSLMIGANQCIVRSRWLCGTGLRRVRRRSGRAGIWYFCGNNILFIIFVTIIICIHVRCKRSRISVREFFFLFCCSVSSASCLLLIVIVLPEVSNFFSVLEMSSIIPISFSLITFSLITFHFQGVAAKCARIYAGICRIKACRITALPTTAVVPNPAVFWRRRRKRGGMSVPSFSPDMTLLTRAGIVKPRLSINTPLILMYL